MCAGAQGEVDGLGPGLKIGRAECRFVGESRLFHLAPYQLYAKRIDIERKRIDFDPVSLRGLHRQPDRARSSIVRGWHRLDIIVDDIEKLQGTEKYFDQNPCQLVIATKQKLPVGEQCIEDTIRARGLGKTGGKVREERRTA